MSAQHSRARLLRLRPYRCQCLWQLPEQVRAEDRAWWSKNQGRSCVLSCRDYQVNGAIDDTWIVCPRSAPTTRARCPAYLVMVAKSPSSWCVRSPSTNANEAPPRTQTREQSLAVLPRNALCLAPQCEQVTIPS